MLPFCLIYGGTIARRKTRVPISVTNVENLVEKNVNVNFVSYIIEVLFDMLRTWIVMW